MIKNRVQVYFNESVPVVTYYQKFGKVRHIDASGTIAEIYAQAREAALPECIFMLGPKACGKSTVSQKMAERTNMMHIDFVKYLLDNGLYGQDDETVIQQFIKYLNIIHPKRVLVENFPQNEFQAKFFIRNGTTPSHVFLLKCSKDVCQERMIDLGEENPNYVPSSILSKRIKEFNDNAVNLIPFLRQNSCFHEVSTDQHIDQSLKTIYNEIEPTIINIRMGKKAGLQGEITRNLVDNHGFINLDVIELQSAEIDRKTQVGEELFKYATHDKVIPSKLIVRMLNKIIYCGQRKLTKFILSNFPEQIE